MVGGGGVMVMVIVGRNVDVGGGGWLTRRHSLWWASLERK